MALSDLEVGVAKVMTAGQDLNVKVGMGAMLGISCSVAGTMSVYDDPATGTATPLGTAIVINAGWNPFPVTFATGLHVALTTAAGTVVYI